MIINQKKAHKERFLTESTKGFKGVKIIKGGSTRIRQIKGSKKDLKDQRGHQQNRINNNRKRSKAKSKDEKNMGEGTI